MRDMGWTYENSNGAESKDCDAENRQNPMTIILCCPAEPEEARRKKEAKKNHWRQTIFRPMVRIPLLFQSQSQAIRYIGVDEEPQDGANAEPDIRQANCPRRKPILGNVNGGKYGEDQIQVSVQDRHVEGHEEYDG